jgi:hypothetical protein
MASSTTAAGWEAPDAACDAKPHNNKRNTEPKVSRAVRGKIMRTNYCLQTYVSRHNDPRHDTPPFAYVATVASPSPATAVPQKQPAPGTAPLHLTPLSHANSPRTPPCRSSFSICLRPPRPPFPLPWGHLRPALAGLRLRFPNLPIFTPHASQADRSHGDTEARRTAHGSPVSPCLSERLPNLPRYHLPTFPPLPPATPPPPPDLLVFALPSGQSEHPVPRVISGLPFS